MITLYKLSLFGKAGPMALISQAGRLVIVAAHAPVVLAVTHNGEQKIALADDTIAHVGFQRVDPRLYKDTT